ncbi:restriction endonuclease subunit S [Bifidobacterium parmae]|uniref:Restriction endonuclease subunit S n=1 Tax=Bifidobacterium parmae TaxID=361854 RepID=A0A2N5J5P4_9BIFI|nr:restriction endonuclease subunit S [Bifidobacterium parmae]PLS29528.1 restriction endonuclease subunit S [Bifidobacterium parmae]
MVYEVPWSLLFQRFHPAVLYKDSPSAWEQRKLGECAQSFSYGLNASAVPYDGRNAYLRITDIDDGTRQFSKNDLTSPDADLARCDDYRLDEGDIVFARTGASVGKTYIYQATDGVTYFAGFLIRMKMNGTANPQFVFQSTLCESYKRYVAITSQRSGQPGVNAVEYAQCPVPIPSLPEQEAIGRFFSRLDDLITLHQRKRL